MLIEETSMDHDLLEVASFIKHQVPMEKNNAFRAIAPELSLHENGLVLFNKKILIPKKLEQRIIEIAHEGHLGEPKCVDIIKRRYYFPKISKKVSIMNKNCLACRASTGNT